MSKTNTKMNSETEIEVLYQKLGDRWFAFSIVEDEVVMSPVSDDQVRAAKTGQNEIFVDWSADETEKLDQTPQRETKVNRA